MKITEKQLRKIICESIKNVLSEGLFNKHTVFTYRVWYYLRASERTNNANKYAYVDIPIDMVYGQSEQYNLQNEIKKRLLRKCHQMGITPARYECINQKNKLF